MRMKNLGFLEQHVEKIVLGVAGLFFVAVVWLYAVANPHTARLSVGTQTVEVGPGGVQRVIEEQVDVLERGLRREDSPLPPWPVTPFVSDLETRVNRNVSPVDALPLSLAQAGLDRTLVQARAGAGGYPRYALPRPPRPEAPKARADFAVMAEVAQPTRRSQAFLRLIGDQQPRDFRYVSLASEFDMQAWQRALRQGPQPRIPEDWWRGQTHVTHIVLERERLNPATGRWGDRTTVPPIPGQGHFARVPADIRPEQAQELVARMRASQVRITQPDLPPLTPHRIWLPPDIDTTKLNNHQRLLAAQVVSQMRQVERQAEISRSGLAADEDDIPIQTVQPQFNLGWDPSMMGESVDDAFGMDPGMGYQFGAGGIDTPGGSVDQQLEALQRQLDAVLNGTHPALAQPQSTPVFGGEYMDPVTGEMRTIPVPTMPSRIARPVGVTRAPRLVPDRNKVRIVVHDVTVEPGAVYRYRVSVGIYNPLFRRRQVDANQLKETLNQIAIVSPASDWTGAVEVDPQRRFYLAGAGAAGGSDVRSTNWEVWRIYKGRWLRNSFSARPGDLIGGTHTFNIDGQPTQIDMLVPAVVVDMDRAQGRLGPTERAIVMNVNDGGLFERRKELDMDDAARVRLTREVAVAEEAVRLMEAAAREQARLQREQEAAARAAAREQQLGGQRREIWRPGGVQPGVPPGMRPGSGGVPAEDY